MAACYAGRRGRLSPGARPAGRDAELSDPNFRRTVVLLVHHDDEGTFGVVLNRPTELSAMGLCTSLDLEWGGPASKGIDWGGPVQPMAASGAWTANSTFTANVCLSQTPFVHTVSLTLSGEEVRFNSEANVAFGPTKEPESRQTCGHQPVGARLAKKWVGEPFGVRQSPGPSVSKMAEPHLEHRAP